MDINKWLECAINADSLQQTDKAGKEYGRSMGAAGWVPFAGSKRKAHEMDVDMDENEAECGPAPSKQYLVDKVVASTETLEKGCRMALQKTAGVTQAEGTNASGSTEKMEESDYKTASHWFGSEEQTESVLQRKAKRRLNLAEVNSGSSAEPQPNGFSCMETSSYSSVDWFSTKSRNGPFFGAGA